MVDYPAILYVEDDEMSRAVMEILLRDQLQLTNIAILKDSHNFEQQLSELQFEPDLILLDIHMQPIDGFGMLQILRSLDAYMHKPIVALTASVMNEEVEQLKDAGFNGVIPKPIDMDGFPDLIEAILDGKDVWRVIKN